MKNENTAVIKNLAKFVHENKKRTYEPDLKIISIMNYGMVMGGFCTHTFLSHLNI